MKQKLFLICLGFCLSTALFATDFLAEENQYLLHFFRQSGTPSRLYLECEKDYLTENGDNTLHFKIGGNIDWYNVRAKFAACWYIFNFGKFDLYYHLYYREKGGNYKEATFGQFEYIDSDIALHSADQIERTRTIAFIKNKTFEYEFDWKFPMAANPGVYEFMLELRVKPSSLSPANEFIVGRHYESGSTNIFCPYESAMAYINGDKGYVSHQKTCSTNKAGGAVLLQYDKSNASVEYGSDFTNPRNSEGYRLVYNHPQAEFAISLSTENAPRDTLLNSSRYYGYTSFLVGIGDTYELPSYKEIENEFSDCILHKSRINDDFQHFFYTYYYHPNLKHYLEKKFQNDQSIIQTIHNSREYGIVHFKSLLLQSNNPDASSFNDVAMSKLADYQPKNGKWFTRTYHLRDLDLVKQTYTNIKENTVFKVWNKMIYNIYPWDELYKSVGCSYYGPISEYVKKGLGKEEDYPYRYNSKNCILYKVVPQVTFKKKEALPTQKVCINTLKNPADFSPEDFIHLQGESIECQNFSPSIYRPLYQWQISEDKVHWENIAADNPFIINKSVLPYNVVMNEEKDLLLNTAILQTHKILYFRQICILQSFASEEESNLYNYCIPLNGKKQYYIAIYGDNYSSYQALPKASTENISWVEKDWSLNTYLCHEEQLNQAEIQFELQAGGNLSPEDLDILLPKSSYKIYHVNTLGEKQLVSTSNHYLIPDTLTQSCQYECVVQFCRDSVSRTMKIIKYPPIHFQLSSIQSEAAIQKIDSLNLQLQLVGLRKINSIQFHDKEIGCRFLQRQEVPYIKPLFYTEEWSLMSKKECIDLITERQWTFEKECNLPLELATLNQLQTYGLKKQAIENKKMHEQAVQDSIQKNQWHSIEDENTQTAFLTPSTKEKETYYFKKLNKNGCESDSLQVTITYCSPIKGNSLELKNYAKDTLYAIKGAGNPYIKGSYPVSGGYGPVDPEKGTSYTYQWMKKSSNGNWEPIVINYHLAAITDSGKKVMNSETKYISLTENTLRNLNGNYEIARFVHSRFKNHTKSQISSISNSIYIITIDSLSSRSVEIDQSKCPTEEIDIVVKEPGNVLNENTTYLWNFSRSDIAYEILSTGYGKQNNRCIIKNAKKDFTVYLKRFDAAKNLVSNVLKIPFDIMSHQSNFRIEFDNQKYQVEDTLIVNVGSKIQLINESPKAEDCKNTWTLQLQDNFLGDHQMIEGTQSSKVHTSCYLYNLGRNPIQLTTINPKGCKSTIIAKNIFVEGIKQSTKKSYFVTESPWIESNDFMRVGPTLLGPSNNYIVKIETNQQNYKVSLYNTAGKELLPPQIQKESCEYNLSFLLPGIYLLQVDETIYKLRIY